MKRFKKLMALAMATVMTMAMSSTAFAADPSDFNTSGQLLVNYKAPADANNDAKKKIYSIAISFDDMQFEYTASAVTWNEQYHNYEITGAWTDKNAQYKVTNNSNCAVDMGVAYDAMTNNQVSFTALKMQKQLSKYSGATQDPERIWPADTVGNGLIWGDNDFGGSPADPYTHYTLDYYTQNWSEDVVLHDGYNIITFSILGVYDDNFALFTADTGENDVNGLVMFDVYLVFSEVPATP